MRNTVTIEVTPAQARTLKAILAKVEPTTPARVSRKAPDAQAKKAERHLTRGNREEFVKAHAWAKGMSTRQIADAVVNGGKKPRKGWAIGERYADLVRA